MLNRDFWAAIAESLLMFGSEFWAAIAGALVGGFFVLASQFIEKKQRERQQRKALAYSIFIKTSKIYSTFRDLRLALENTVAEATKKGGGVEHWQYYQTRVGLPVPIHFSSDEMALFLLLGDHDIFNDLALRDDIHNATLAMFQTLNERRQALVDMLPPPDRIDGGRGSLELSENEMRMLRPRMIEIYHLFDDAMERCRQEEQKTRDLLSRVQVLIKNKLGIIKKIAFEA